LLTEQNQVNPGRVDIDENDGWFVEINASNNEESPKFRTTNYSLLLTIKSPEIEPLEITNSAYDFVKNDINELCDSMASINFPENGYRDIINMNTFIDFIMINEIVDNQDFQWPLSTYLYKNKDDKINMSPLWDFDCGYGYDYSYNFFNDPSSRIMHRNSMNAFFKKFFDDPLFLARYKERWNEKYSDITAVNEFIDVIANKIENSAIENFKTWWYKTISTWWVVRYEKEDNDFWQEISNIKYYLGAHISYLNTELNKVEVLPKNKTFTPQVFGYTETATQTFTFVSYGDMADLSATLKTASETDGVWGLGSGVWGI
jgi:hypothetical protein